ncbi:MerR family transcriptional regulator [Paenibacillus sp. MER 180]|uniref:MerR family transcriptional regulator n=1 Tax=Paenibacillus sp. MER 180 TaxID=2939570 RepID=UPI00203A6842|nr:MerR family transcriptional regulator [Paenibacillus sp. MER 180]MCM3288922.1 MerR family transcriptional regulator [Paenibacillus sp. MER 180]
MEERNTYRTSQLSEILGVTRDALRYYEEQGIVNPKQNESNHYRQYDYYDIYTLMVADFYKKRNLSIKEVKRLQVGSEIEELGALLGDKASKLEETIRMKAHMLQKIKETQQFCEDIKHHLNQYSIKEFPAYKVIGEISDFTAFQEYPVILEHTDSMKDDILSRIMRQFTFDETGFLDTKMYIVEKLEAKPTEEGRYLEFPSCIYTIVEDGRFQNGSGDIKHQVFEHTLTWGRGQGLTPKGVAFVNTRLITYLDNMERVFLEIYIPVEGK